MLVCAAVMPNMNCVHLRRVVVNVSPLDKAGKVVTGLLSLDECECALFEKKTCS